MSGRLPDAVRRLLELPEGERKIGAFRLKRPLGQGGFAPVWLADEVAGSAVLRQAAVKLFALERGGEARQAIIDEAARLCRLEHPNIVRFYALPTDEARAVVGLVMEYVAGKSLAQVLLERRELPVAAAIPKSISL
jgi:serine/threonine protein kinase